jgi:murein DD-endopeptidase MepM/ murein hydrolase activator NlpD
VTKPTFLLRLTLLLTLLIASCNPVVPSSDLAAPSPTSTLPATRHSPLATPLSPPATRYSLPATPYPAPATPTAAPTAVATAIPLAPITNPPDEGLAQTAVAYDAEFIRPDAHDTAFWHYAPQSFIHPLALAVRQNVAYLLDGGRVLAFDLAQPTPPELLLQPGDVVEGVTVLEPLDVAVAPDGLLALDRAGDVYLYDWATRVWRLDRYDRPIGDTSSHYYVAVDGAANGRYLLEMSYLYALHYAAAGQIGLWMLPESRAVDIAVAGDNVYVLLQEMDSLAGRLLLYRDTATVPSFRPAAIIHQPLQVLATETAVYVLDENGRRLLVFEPQSGRLRQLWQLPVAAGISAVGLSAAGDVILAGRERLFFYGQGSGGTAVAGGPALVGPQPHDPEVLTAVTGLVSPLGPHLSARDLQMPGAPRHYRLGVHEGADFYWQLDSPVTAVADGVVIRATHDYVPPYPADFYAWQSEAQRLGYTSAAALDFFRGRQVWLQHDDGLVSRYVHLNSIDYRVQEGATVTQGQLIGAVGNSGSPGSLEGEGVDAHLHLELWLDSAGQGHYIGQFLRPVETRYWLERILFP